MVLINGKNTSADGKTVSQYLEEANFNPQTIAVELNEDILPKPQYGETVLKDDDVLEVVSFVGGGYYAYQRRMAECLCRSTR